MEDSNKSNGKRYLQTNQKGYITGVVSESLLAGLHGGDPKNFRVLSNDEARQIEETLKERHSQGEGLHIVEIDSLIGKNAISDEYIRKRYGNVPAKNVRNIREAMSKYGENRWWESKDSRVVAMYQVFEDVLLTDFSTFHNGLEKLCDRPVRTHELGLNINGIRQEARAGIERLKQGIGISDEAREHYVLKSIQMLEDYCKRTGKQFLKIDLTNKPEDKRKDGIDESGYDGWLKPD